jgi:hypothetical protein
LRWRSRCFDHLNAAAADCGGPGRAAGKDFLLAAAADHCDTGKAAGYILVAAAAHRRIDRRAKEDVLDAAAQHLGEDRGAAGFNNVFNNADDAGDAGESVETSVGVERRVEGRAASKYLLSLKRTAKDDRPLGGAPGENLLYGARLNRGGAIDAAGRNDVKAAGRDRRTDRLAAGENRFRPAARHLRVDRLAPAGEQSHCRSC